MIDDKNFELISLYIITKFRSQRFMIKVIAVSREMQSSERKYI